MVWRSSPYLAPMFLAGAIAAALAAYAWRRRDQRAARPFALYMAGLSVWSVAYGIELGFETIGPMLLWDKVSFLGAAVVPTAWFLLAAEFAGRDRWLSRRVLALLAVEPALVVLLVWTNEAHGLIWRAASVDASGLFPVPALAFGPAYWANLLYSYVLVVAGAAILVKVVVRAGSIYRRQGAVLLAGTLVPLLANLVFNVVPSANPVPNLDFTPFAFVASGVFYAVALFRYRMLDLVPTAREALLDEVEDGVVVLDVDGRIVDANPVARAALGGAVPGGPIGGTPIGSASGVRTGLVELPVDGTNRSFEVSTAPLTDFRGETVGRFVHLRDTTQLQVLRDQEQRLSVLNRVLRHNLRNELNVVAGQSRTLMEDLEGDERARAETIHAAATRMLDIGEKARHIETTIGGGYTGRVPIDVAGLAAGAAEDLAAARPAASVTYRGPESAWAAVVGRDQFRVALENLAENAVEHNPAEAPQVAFEVAVDGGTVSVSVADDGPGIPAIERDAIDRDRETPLVHGSGLGLWIVRWIVDASEGALRFDDRETAGSVVTIELDRREPPAEQKDGEDDTAPGPDDGSGARTDGAEAAADDETAGEDRDTS